MATTPDGANDVGTQYRTGLYPHNEAQRAAALLSIEKEQQRQMRYRRKVVTEVRPAKVFWPARHASAHHGAQVLTTAPYSPHRCAPRRSSGRRRRSTNGSSKRAASRPPRMRPRASAAMGRERERERARLRGQLGQLGQLERDSRERERERLRRGGRPRIAPWAMRGLVADDTRVNRPVRSPAGLALGLGGVAAPAPLSTRSAPQSHPL